MRLVDSAALQAADLVLVDTEERRMALPSALRTRTACVSRRCDSRVVVAGASALGRERRSALRVVFVGLYTPLHGTSALAEAIAHLSDDPRIEVTMVGDGQDRGAAERLAATNTKWRGWTGWRARNCRRSSPTMM